MQSNAARKPEQSKLSQAMSAVGAVSDSATATVCDTKSLPITGTDALAGSKSAKLDAVATFQQYVFATLSETPTERTDGQSKVESLFLAFEDTDVETIKTALDLKKAGFAQKSTPYVQLSIARTWYRAWSKLNTGEINRLTGDVVAYEDKDGNVVTSGSFKARTVVMRALLAKWADMQKQVSIDAKAYGEAIAALPEDADKGAVIEKAEALATEAREALEVEQTEAYEFKHSAAGYAERLAKLLYREGGFEFGTDVIDALPEALAKVERDALAKAAKIAKAKLDAAK